MVELTVPWEDRMEEAYERKLSKYTDLASSVREKGWQAWIFPVEVGARGFTGKSVYRLCTSVGIVGNERRAALQRVGDAAERASCWL